MRGIGPLSPSTRIAEPTPESTLLNAADYFEAAKALSEKDLHMPTATCASLACELYLKTLYAKCEKARPKEHNLVRLFDGLPAELKDIIRDCFVKWYPHGTQDTFREELEAMQGLFVEARYADEWKLPRYNYGALMSFMQALNFVSRTLIYGEENAMQQRE